MSTDRTVIAGSAKINIVEKAKRSLATCEPIYPTTVLALISALDTAVEALREIYNECDCTELCLCSNDMKVRARQALAAIFDEEG